MEVKCEVEPRCHFAYKWSRHTLVPPNYPPLPLNCRGDGSGTEELATHTIYHYLWSFPSRVNLAVTFRVPLGCLYCACLRQESVYLHEKCVFACKDAIRRYKNMIKPQYSQKYVFGEDIGLFKGLEEHSMSSFSPRWLSEHLCLVGSSLQ